MKSEKIFIAFQSGFRSPFSTDTCLTHLTDQIRFRIDRCFYTGMVMIDLQKAFDTVDHEILLQKLKALGFDPLAIKWFEKYMQGTLTTSQGSDTVTSIFKCNSSNTIKSLRLLKMT